MTGVLTQFVLDNIWCVPGQDKELVVKPVCLNGDSAVFRSFRYLGREINLPNNSNSWCVYQIGSYYQTDQQLLLYQKDWEFEKWLPLSKAVNEEDLLITAFVPTGITFPLFQTFYMYTQEKALLIAIALNSKIPADPRVQDVYIKFYRNAFRETDRAQDANYSMKAENKILETSNDIVSVNTRINVLTRDRGQCIVTINGQRYKRPDKNFVNPGDIVEWIYDPTIDFVETYKLSQTKLYQSSVDNELKVILHSKSKNYFTSIAFYDDLEIELYTPLSTNSFYGLYIPVFDFTTLRMLSHRDYGLKKSVYDIVKDFLLLNNPSSIVPDLQIEIKFRKSGFERNIVPNSSKILDLYALPDSKIIDAFAQNPVVFQYYTGANLENAPYVQAMRLSKDEIDEEFSEDVLGYNVLTLLYGTGPQKVTVSGNNKTVPVPEYYIDGFTAYEYNFAGQFLQYVVSNGPIYTAAHPNCNSVELIRGNASQGPVARYGDNNLPFDPYWSYRVWSCAKVNGAPTYNWVDITDTTNYQADKNAGIISWDNPNNDKFLMVRDDSLFTASTISVTFTKNLLFFDLTEYIDKNDGSGSQLLPMDVPGSDLTIFLNSRSLIKDLDYFVLFPRVFITNIAYLKQDLFSNDQLFHYRVNGLGEGTGKFSDTLDRGIVSHGFVGTGTRYVPKNDRPIRVVIDGYLKLNDTVKYSQDDRTFEDPQNNLNGLPYEIKDYVISLSSFLEENQEPFRTQAKQLDQQLISYMSLNMEGPLRGTETRNPKTKLLCPFHAALVDELLSGELDGTPISSSQTNVQVLATVQPFMYLVDASPANPIFELSTNVQIQICPHPRLGKISLETTERLNFLIRVSNLVFPGLNMNFSLYFL